MPGRLCSPIAKIIISGTYRALSGILGAQALPHNAGVTVRQWATEVPQVKNGAQALPHNDGVTVRQWATEVPQVQNGAQALDSGFRQWGWAGKSLLLPWRQGNPKGRKRAQLLFRGPVAKRWEGFFCAQPTAGNEAYPFISSLHG